MPRCRICSLDKANEDFSITNGYLRQICKACRNEQRRQRYSDGVSVTTADYSAGGGGAVTLAASDGDYDVTALEWRIRDSLRPIDEQLRVLTDEHRKGSIASTRMGQRLVQLEREMQSRRGAMETCECTKPDPLWNILLIVALSTCMFIILRWVESQLASVRHARAEENHRRHT